VQTSATAIFNFFNFHNKMNSKEVDEEEPFLLVSVFGNKYFVFSLSIFHFMSLFSFNSVYFVVSAVDIDKNPELPKVFVVEFSVGDQDLIHTAVNVSAQKNQSVSEVLGNLSNDDSIRVKLYSKEGNEYTFLSETSIPVLCLDKTKPSPLNIVDCGVEFDVIFNVLDDSYFTDELSFASFDVSQMQVESNDISNDDSRFQTEDNDNNEFSNDNSPVNLEEKIGNQLENELPLDHALINSNTQVDCDTVRDELLNIQVNEDTKDSKTDADADFQAKDDHSSVHDQIPPYLEDYEDRYDHGRAHDDGSNNNFPAIIQSISKFPAELSQEFSSDDDSSTERDIHNDSQKEEEEEMSKIEEVEESCQDTSDEENGNSGLQLEHEYNEFSYDDSRFLADHDDEEEEDEDEHWHRRDDEPHKIELHGQHSKSSPVFQSVSEKERRWEECNEKYLERADSPEDRDSCTDRGSPKIYHMDAEEDEDNDDDEYFNNKNAFSRKSKYQSDYYYEDKHRPDYKLKSQQVYHSSTGQDHSADDDTHVQPYEPQQQEEDDEDQIFRIETRRDSFSPMKGSRLMPTLLLSPTSPEQQQQPQQHHQLQQTTSSFVSERLEGKPVWQIRFITIYHYLKQSLTKLFSSETIPRFLNSLYSITEFVSKKNKLVYIRITDISVDSLIMFDELITDCLLKVDHLAGALLEETVQQLSSALTKFLQFLSEQCLSLNNQIANCQEQLLKVTKQFIAFSVQKCHPLLRTVIHRGRPFIKPVTATFKKVNTTIERSSLSGRYYKNFQRITNELVDEAVQAYQQQEDQCDYRSNKRILEIQ
jgi:hypothetical protein